VRAAKALKGIDCRSFQREEIRNCCVVDFPLWSVRPYRHPNGEPLTDELQRSCKRQSVGVPPE
jgi:hypothetical protein